MIFIIHSANNETLNFPSWILILVGIFLFLSIIAAIYKIFSYRRISIIGKKMDYLIEDLIYKSELVTPIIETFIKLSKYIDIMEVVLKENSDSLLNITNKNKKVLKKISNDMKELINESRKKEFK